MKNISRRVFIKGMAVAAVATAASTVLAGCNVPGTTGEGAPVTGFQSQTQTMTLEDDVKFTLTTTSSAVTADDKIKVGVTLVNETKKGIHFWNDKSGTGTLNVHVKAYFDGKYIDSKDPVTGGDKSMWYSDNTKAFDANNTPDTGLSSTYTHKGYFYFTEPKEWSTMTLVFTVDDYKNVKNETVTKELQFTINK